MNYLEVPADPTANPRHPDTEWRRIDNVDEINQHLTAYNRRHFQQAHGTPFTIPPLSTLLGHNGLTTTGDTILNGTFDSSDFDPLMQRLLNSIQRRCPELPTPNITEQDFHSSFATWRETTTTSPSGRHLGHLKSLLHTIPDDDLEWPPSSMKPQQIFHIIYQIAKLCLQHGHVLARWETVHNLLIQKELGNQKINRLRTIHIQECDW